MKFLESPLRRLSPNHGIWRVILSMKITARSQSSVSFTYLIVYLNRYFLPGELKKLKDSVSSLRVFLLILIQTPKSYQLPLPVTLFQNSKPSCIKDIYQVLKSVLLNYLSKTVFIFTFYWCVFKSAPPQNKQTNKQTNLNRNQEINQEL